VETPTHDVDTAQSSAAPNIAVTSSLRDAVMLALTRLGVGDLPNMPTASDFEMPA
jgi:hypothetical protein